jgi:hypothetical protein
VILGIILAFSSFALLQQSATTSGQCSPISPNNSGAITINCPGMSKEQGQKMIAILNKILADQLDPDAVMAKLDEIIANQEKQSEEIGKIKGQQGPWLLDPTIQERMFDSLKNAPKVPVIVESQTRSTQNFSQGIVNVFMKLKWPLRKRITESSNAPIIGIECFGSENVRDSMAQIETALQLISPDIRCVARPEARVFQEDRGFVNIVVGERP